MGVHDSADENTSGVWILTTTATVAYHLLFLPSTMTSRNLKENEPTAINVQFPAETITLMKTLLKLTKLPQAPPINTTPPWSLGIDLRWLTQLKATFESDEWQADKLLESINSQPNYIVRMKATDEADETEFVDLHFMHIKSSKPNATPLLMLHGWPGMCCIDKIQKY